jgi:uncharacterized protein
MSELFTMLAQHMDEHAHEDALEPVSVHGALTFLAIAGQTHCSDELIRKAWGDDLPNLPAPVLAQWVSYAEALLLELVSVLHDGLAPLLPFEPTLDWEDSAQQAWCVGFMLTVFDWADQLPDDSAEAWAEAMLPIEVGSGLFVEEPEFANLYEDEELLSSLFEQIPEVLVDLFLLMNSTAEDA